MPARATEPPAEAPATATPAKDGFVRVPAAKLDTLLTRTGELLVARRRAEARLESVAKIQEAVGRWQQEWRHADRAINRLITPGQTRAGRGAAGATAFPRRAAHAFGNVTQNLRSLARDLDRLAAGLRADTLATERAAGPLEEEVHRVRLMPFGEACEGLPRTVRDLARASGKEAELRLSGGDVELDRSILERLKDPLLHLVRNAVDHGIEPAEERLAAGKPGSGRIRLAAALRGGRVEVTVEDDGRGIDLAGIKRRAEAKGIALPATDAEAARLAFLPGISTSRLVTKVSGRGIGLDVVKTEVESLHGSVGISFEPGHGTRFALAVPLTITTIRALIVESEGQTFAIPGPSVRTLRRTSPEELRFIEGRASLLSDGALVPLVPLGHLMGVARAREEVGPAPRVPVVVLSSGDRVAAFAVDALVAEQDVVVKALGPRLARLPHVAGATILPTGRVALILNASSLVRDAVRESAPSVAGAKPAAAKAPRKRLLVVEDSVTTRSLETSILESEGFEVIAAPDGEAAWRLLQEKGADLVVSDIEMPQMDGFALTEAIRASRRFRDLPVVLVTALESEKDKARGIEVGANAYLVKSAFDQRELLDVIGQLL